jgi:hypothetical protein
MTGLLPLQVEKLLLMSSVGGSERVHCLPCTQPALQQCL